MTKKPIQRANPRLIAVNGFGFFGYLNDILLWLWVVVLLLPVFFETDFAQMILGNHTVTPAGDPQPILEIPQPIGIVIGVIITGIILAVIGYIIVKFPSAVGKTGQKITTKTADVIVPAITHHRKITTKKRKILTLRLTWTVKALLLVIPLLLLLLSFKMTLPLPLDIIWPLAIYLSSMGFAMFGIQAILAQSWKIPTEQVW